MYALDDTIAAIATPLGQGGIGIVRLSGPEALAIAAQLFRPSARHARPWQQMAAPNQLYHGHVYDPAGNAVDEVLAAYLRAPRTYTRQDVVEINTHGGPAPLQAILRLCLATGARLAHEGEFTLRAFLNGRIDLAQAEAVLDVVSARSEGALRVALGQLTGRLSQQVRAVRASLLDVLAYLEATVDFDDDIPPQDVGPALAEAALTLEQLGREAERGIVYRQGVRTAIVGRPNVGKSSLLNALLRVDRAIVTPIPGTTRDTLEETFQLDGVPFVLVDTAGLGATADVIERLGVERALRSAQAADLVLVVVDGSTPAAAGDQEAAAAAGQRAAVVVVNKADLPQVDGYGALLPAAPHVAASALTGEGIPELEDCLLEAVLGGRVAPGAEPLVSNPRHRDLALRAASCVQDAIAALACGRPNDLIAMDVAEAVQALGEITGETAHEELLASIFSRFCIGK